MSWEPIVIVASLWLAAGMTFASVLYRRGYDGWHWMFRCAVAGPLSALLVADQARFVEPQAEPTSTQRFAPHDVQLVQVPGRTADAVVSWAADHGPALILTTRGAHEPSTVGRLARLAAGRRAVGTVIADPAAIAAADGPSPQTDVGDDLDEKEAPRAHR